MEQRIRCILKARGIKIISMENAVDFKINFQFQSAETVKVEAQGTSNIIIYTALGTTYFFAGINKDVHSFPGKRLISYKTSYYTLIRYKNLIKIYFQST